MTTDDRAIIASGTLQEAASVADALTRQNTFALFQSEKAIRTNRAYYADLGIFAEWLSTIRGIDATPSQDDLYHRPEAWRNITHGLVTLFRSYLLDQGYATKSIARILASVRQYATLAYQAGIVSESVWQPIQLVHSYAGKSARRIDDARSTTRRGTKKATPPTMPPEVIARLKTQPDTLIGWRDRFLICLLMDHGLRIGEIHALRLEQIDVVHQQMTFYREKVDKTQIHRLTPDTYHALVTYQLRGGPRTGSPWIAIHKNGTVMANAISVRALQKRVAHLASAVALQLSPHDLRHYWATVALAAGTSIHDLQEAGGWSSPVMPLRYAQAGAIANEGVKLITPVIPTTKP